MLINPPQCSGRYNCYGTLFDPVGTNNTIVSPLSFGQLSHLRALPHPINAARRNCRRHNVLPLVQTRTLTQNIPFTSAVSQGSILFILLIKPGWRDKSSSSASSQKTQGWEEWLIDQMVVPLFRGTLTGWRNGPTGISWISTKGNAKLCLCFSDPPWRLLQLLQ